MADHNPHFRAAVAHERAAEAHARSAVMFDDTGDPELADLERRSEELEIEAADIEHERGRIHDEREMDERLSRLLDASRD